MMMVLKGMVSYTIDVDDDGGGGKGECMVTYTMGVDG
jgi:hypothetical protein